MILGLQTLRESFGNPKIKSTTRSLLKKILALELTMRTKILQSRRNSSMLKARTPSSYLKYLTARKHALSSLPRTSLALVIILQKTKRLLLLQVKLLVKETLWLSPCTAQETK
jgi:hypothetical protein